MVDADQVLGGGAAGTLPDATIAQSNVTQHEAAITHDNLIAGTIADHDTSATGTQLDTLVDNSMADALHRHSELSASDGTPDATLSIDAIGNITGGTLIITNSGQFSNVGIGTAPATATPLKVSKAGINTTDSYYGFFNLHQKTAGVTGVNDDFWGISNYIEYNQSGGVIGNSYGMFNEIQMADGDIGDGSNSRNLRGLGHLAVMSGGKIYGNTAGTYVEIDQGAGNEITGSMYGHYITVDADGTVGSGGEGGAVYMIYLNEGSNIDYGIYQNGSAANLLGGSLTVTGKTRFNDRIYFTQADEGEYIDSLADNELTIGAVSKIHLVATDVTGTVSVVNSTSSFEPGADGVMDLGTSSKEWKDLFIDGTANLDDVDIDGTIGVGDVAPTPSIQLRINKAYTGGAVNYGGLITVTQATNINTIAGLGSTATSLHTSGNMIQVLGYFGGATAASVGTDIILGGVLGLTTVTAPHAPVIGIAYGVAGICTLATVGQAIQAVALYAQTNTKTSGVITTNYGLLVADQTAGATNYAIFTGVGTNHFGDDVEVVGRISSATLTFSTVGPTDNLDVSGVNTLFIDNSSNAVIIGGFAGGVDGQVLYVALINAGANNVTLEHNETGATQKIFLHAGADETLNTEYGGWVFVCHGGVDWHDCSHARHV